MSDQKKKVDKLDDDLIQACQEVWQTVAAPSVAARVVEHFRYQWETKHLRGILGREPIIWDRLQYRVYLEFAGLVLQGRYDWSDEAKIFEAAWEDAVKLDKRCW